MLHPWTPPLPSGLIPSATSRRCVAAADRKSTRLNSSHANISYAVFCLKKKKKKKNALAVNKVEQEKAVNTARERLRCPTASNFSRCTFLAVTDGRSRTVQRTRRRVSVY